LGEKKTRRRIHLATKEEEGKFCDLLKQALGGKDGKTQMRKRDRPLLI